MNSETRFEKARRIAMWLAYAGLATLLEIWITDGAAVGSACVVALMLAAYGVYLRREAELLGEEGDCDDDGI